MGSAVTLSKEAHDAEVGSLSSEGIIVNRQQVPWINT